jgi:very-short-patch-repair endonuclease
VAARIRANGGALSYRDLDALGVSRSAVAAALAAGSILPVRTRRFAVPDAPPDVARAVRVGGSLTATSLARLEGLWTRPDSLLHVRVPRTAGRLWAPEPPATGGVRVALDRREHSVCVHYRTTPGATGARDPLPLALAELASCSPRLDAHIAVDSALSLRRLDARGLAELRSLLGPSRRSIVDHADSGCQSGTETIVRLLLRGRRVGHRTQAWVTGVGRVDVLVGDRLVIEIDGEGFHTGVEFERDRRRDFELVMRGYLVLRLSYDMVMREWDAVRDGILGLIERGEHRWGARSRHHEREARGSLARRHLAE